MYRHILIATDGSALAEKAVNHGLALAKSVGAKVTALIVEAPFNAYAVPESKALEISTVFAEHEEHNHKHAATVLGHVAEVASAAGVACNTIETEHPRPHEMIVRAAEENGCDAIVMATHGRTGISAALYGSVTSKVLTRTKIPVVVCH